MAWTGDVVVAGGFATHATGRRPAGGLAIQRWCQVGQPPPPWRSIMTGGRRRQTTRRCYQPVVRRRWNHCQRRQQLAPAHVVVHRRRPVVAAPPQPGARGAVRRWRGPLVDSVASGGVRVAIGSEPSALDIDSANRWQERLRAAASPRTAGSSLRRPRWRSDRRPRWPRGQRLPPPRCGPRTFAGEDPARSGWRLPGDSIHKGLAAGHLTDVVHVTPGGFVAVGLEDFGARRQAPGPERQQSRRAAVGLPGRHRLALLGVADARVDEEYLGVHRRPVPGGARRRHRPASGARGPAAESVAPAGGPGPASLEAVAAGGRRVHRRRRPSTCPGDADPIILLSPDGTRRSGRVPAPRWAGHPALRRRVRRPRRHRHRRGAVGGATGSNDVDAAVRQDGEWSGWPPAARSPAGGDQQAYGCAASEDGFIIVGSDDRSGNADARVWTSADGMEWTEVESSMLGGTGDQWASAVAAVPGGGWLVGRNRPARRATATSPCGASTPRRHHPPRPRRAAPSAEPASNGVTSIVDRRATAMSRSRATTTAGSACGSPTRSTADATGRGQRDRLPVRRPLPADRPAATSRARPAWCRAWRSPGPAWPRPGPG